MADAGATGVGGAGADDEPWRLEEEAVMVIVQRIGALVVRGSSAGAVANGPSPFRIPSRCSRTA
jgi:hypothetical protein